jgi:LPXTG-motif cell wall-anchored protein
LSTFNSTSAKVLISSNTITAYLTKGVLKEFDLDGDNVNDIRVRYDGTVGSKAQLFIQKIVPAVVETGNTVSNEEPTTTTPEETATTENNANTATQESTNTNIPTVDREASLRTSKIIVFVGLMLLLALVLFFSLRKKKKRAYASFY